MTHGIRGKNREASVSFSAEAAEAPLAFSILRKIHVRGGQSKKGSLRAAQLLFWVLPEFQKTFWIFLDGPFGALESFPPCWEPLMTNLQLNYTLFSLPFLGKIRKKKKKMFAEGDF